jgi:hypothetical protein
MTAIAGLLTAVLLWWLIKNAARADPKQVVRLAKVTGGGVALLFAGLLLLRGRLDMAALLGGAGAWLLGWGAPPGWWPAALGGRPSSPLVLRSPTLELAMDSRTGAMSGRIFAGEFAGSQLDQLGAPELIRLRSACLGRDVEGGRLVEAYLDRRFPGWREHAQGDPNLRGRADLQHGAMTEQEAHEILGLQPGAGPDEIRMAHRRLMKRLHPDLGGSTYLASRVNQAKDLLLDRHR